MYIIKRFFFCQPGAPAALVDQLHREARRGAQALDGGRLQKDDAGTLRRPIRFASGGTTGSVPSGFMKRHIQWCL
jgi:hypothetical protein